MAKSKSKKRRKSKKKGESRMKCVIEHVVFAVVLICLMRMVAGK